MIPDALKILERLARIEEKQEAAREQLEHLDEKLFGNGQPGVLSALDGRVRSVERRVWMWLGAGGAISIVITVVGLYIAWKK